MTLNFFPMVLTGTMIILMQTVWHIVAFQLKYAGHMDVIENRIMQHYVSGAKRYCMHRYIHWKQMFIKSVYYIQNRDYIL